MTMMKHSSAKAAVNFSTTGSFSHNLLQFSVFFCFFFCCCRTLTTPAKWFYLVLFFFFSFLMYRICVGLTEADFQRFMKDVNTEWKCPKCLDQAALSPAIKLKSWNQIQSMSQPCLHNYNLVFFYKKLYVLNWFISYHSSSPPPSKCFHVLFPRNLFNLYQPIFNIHYFFELFDLKTKETNFAVFLWVII